MIEVTGIVPRTTVTEQVDTADAREAADLFLKKHPTGVIEKIGDLFLREQCRSCRKPIFLHDDPDSYYYDPEDESYLCKGCNDAQKASRA